MHPRHELLAIAGLIAFDNEFVDSTVDGVAEPRPRTHFVPWPGASRPASPRNGSSA